jgi:death-on-curing protein
MSFRVMLWLAESMPGGPGVSDYGALVAAEQRHAAHVAGIDYYPTLPAQAAALVHSLARVEALTHRNRTFAWLVAMRFLTQNEVVVKATVADVLDTMAGVADGHMSVQDLATWFADRIG